VQDQDIRKLAEEVVLYLRDRHHPEKPHISVLSPPPLRTYSEIWSGICGRTFESELRAEEEEEEEVAEAIEEYEDISRLKYAGWIFGSDFEVEGGGNAEVVFRFTARVGHDSDDESKRLAENYRDVEVKVNLQSNKYDVKVRIKGPQGEYSEVASFPTEGGYLALAITHSDVINRLDSELLRQALRSIADWGLQAQATLTVRVLGVREFPAADVNISCRRGRQSDNCRLYYAVAVLVGLYGGLFKAYLLNIGPYIQCSGRCLDEICKRLHRIYAYNEEEGTRWALGHLFEVEGSARFSNGVKPRVKWDEHGIRGAYPVNSIALEESGIYKLRDYHVAEEELPEIERSKRPTSEFFDVILNSINCRQDEQEKFKLFVKSLAKALEEEFGIKNLYTYQEDATRAILEGVGILPGDKQRGAVAIMARTAGGKTLAFLIPSLIYIAYRKYCEGKAGGVKVLLMYPTKALANDQLEEVAHLLYYVWKRSGIKISFGLLHGNVKHIEEINEPIPLPLTCPVHGEGRIELLQRGRLTCSTGGDNCKFAKFISEAMKATRDAVYYEPPDLLISDEDMINRILSGASKRHSGEKSALWFEWQLLGFDYKRCTTCGHTYPYHLGIRKSSVCKSEKLEVVEGLDKIGIIVMDEAHQVTGSFGVQVRHMLSLLEWVLGKRPLYVLSSATLSNVESFARELLNLGEGSYIDIIKANVLEGKETRKLRRTFVFLMPKAYSREATAVKALELFSEMWNKKTRQKPRGVIFTNTLAESNEVIQSIRDSIIAIEVSGHTTDYDPERIDVELQFKRKKIDWLVATSTLELGVDYGDVDFVVIFGMPRRLSSFVQRIGRAGRKRDAVVFVIFNPDIPLDYYFYENHKLLSDGALREKAMGKEVLTIGLLNEEATRRAVKRWFVAYLHYLCASGLEQAACNLVAGVSSGGEEARDVWGRILRHLGRILRHLLDVMRNNVVGSACSGLPQSICRVASIQQYRELINNQLKRIIDFIEREKQRLPSIDKLINSSGELNEYSLYQLRGSDDEVVFIYPILQNQSRRRELRYAVKKALAGMVTSYKGHFFLVGSVQGESVTKLSDWLK